VEVAEGHESAVVDGVVAFEGAGLSEAEEHD
jgi:hypothetical protein